MIAKTAKGAVHTGFLKWSGGIAITFVILLAVAAGLEWFNNNFSFRRPSRAEFVGNLDQALSDSTGWVLDQYQVSQPGVSSTPEGRDLVSNAALAHMIVDCAALSSDPRLKELGSLFLEAWKENRGVLGKVVAPALPANPPTERELQGLAEYQRWTIYGAAPDEVPLSRKELEDMFSPDQYRTGKATHQLFALYLYRKSKGTTPELDRLMKRIEERIAWEAAVDFRVTDLYLQRVAFLLASGRPDLVRPRWVERSLAAQQTDGGWLRSWHGWGPPPYRLSLGDKWSNPHSTAQGMWIACMLRYRYPHWIEKNYR